MGQIELQNKSWRELSEKNQGVKVYGEKREMALPKIL